MRYAKSRRDERSKPAELREQQYYRTTTVHIHTVEHEQKAEIYRRKRHSGAIVLKLQSSTETHPLSNKKNPAWTYVRTVVFRFVIIDVCRCPVLLELRLYLVEYIDGLWSAAFRIRTCLHIIYSSTAYE